MKILPQAIVVGTIAAFAVLMSSKFGLHAWALFLAWVGYFVLGPSARQACLSWIQILIGMTIGAGLIITNSVLEPQFGSWALVGLVFILASGLTFMEQVKPFDNIPAYYIGMIMLFASGMSPSFSAILDLMIPITLGLFLGWLTVTAREKLNTRISPSTLQ